MRRQLPLLFLLATGCASVDPPAYAPGAVERWGTLREALRDGQTQARVDAGDVAQAGMYGVGAMAALDGELTMFDGELVVSRVRDGAVETERPTRAQATLLVASYVPEWQEVEVTEEVDPSQLGEFVAARAAECGLDTSRPFVFVVEGELRHLQVHVLAGECPIRARRLGEEMSSPPHEQRYDAVRGRLVGVHALDAGGVLTHHGAAVHAHALVDGDGGWTGHAETVGLAPGAVLRLPAQQM